MAAILNIVKRDSHAAVWQILMKFGMLMCWCVLAHTTWLATINVKFWKS